MHFPAISMQTTRQCRTAARKFSVFPKVLELDFCIWDCVFQNTSDNSFDYIAIYLET